jgi:hypothetical protein
MPKGASPLPRQGSTPLRDFAAPSYDTKTGRSASSIQEQGTGAKGNHTSAVGAQVPTISNRDRSGSADSGRNVMGGSKLP